MNRLPLTRELSAQPTEGENSKGILCILIIHNIPCLSRPYFFPVHVDGGYFGIGMIELFVLPLVDIGIEELHAAVEAADKTLAEVIILFMIATVSVMAFT